MTPDATASKEAWFLVRMLCDNRNQTRGRSPVNLLEEDLIDLGVTRVGHRMNIERALKQLLDR